MPEPIKITIYGENDEPVKECVRRIIPWGLLKKAVKLQKDLSEAKAKGEAEKQMDLINGFVVELFKDQFTADELANGADTGEVIAVFQAVLARANAAVKSNPTLPPQ